jgi:hypothetical protein
MPYWFPLLFPELLAIRWFHVDSTLFILRE